MRQGKSESNTVPFSNNHLLDFNVCVPQGTTITIYSHVFKFARRVHLCDRIMAGPRAPSRHTQAMGQAELWCALLRQPSPSQVTTRRHRPLPGRATKRLAGDGVKKLHATRDKVAPHPGSGRPCAGRHGIMHWRRCVHAGSRIVQRHACVLVCTVGTQHTGRHIHRHVHKHVHTHTYTHTHAHTHTRTNTLSHAHRPMLFGGRAAELGRLSGRGMRVRSGDGEKT